MSERVEDAPQNNTKPGNKNMEAGLRIPYLIPGP